MRRLLLLRHARAAPATGGDDYGRPLTPEGEEEAAHLGDLLAREGLGADSVLCSGALRARKTATLALGRLPAAPAIKIENRLYDASWRLVLALACDLPEASASALLLVGHNPGMGDLANWLTGEGDRAERQRMAQKFPPCGLAIIDFEVAGWPDLAARSGTLVRFVTPADFDGE